MLRSKVREKNELITLRTFLSHFWPPRSILYDFESVQRCSTSTVALLLHCNSEDSQ